MAGSISTQGSEGIMRKMSSARLHFIRKHYEPSDYRDQAIAELRRRIPRRPINWETLEV